MTEKRYPYPNVRATAVGRWAAYLPCKPVSRYLGSFDSPEEAYVRVLQEQAAGHEAVAAAYRARIEEIA